MDNEGSTHKLAPEPFRNSKLYQRRTHPRNLNFAEFDWTGFSSTTPASSLHSCIISTIFFQIQVSSKIILQEIHHHIHSEGLESLLTCRGGSWE